MTIRRQARRPDLLRKVAASLAVLGVAAGLELFAATGSFDSGHDPFPHAIAVDR